MEPRQSAETFTELFNEPADPLKPPAAPRYRTELDVLRMILPTTPVRQSFRVWDLTVDDELRLPVEAAVTLARNGIRIGVASSPSLEPIQGILSLPSVQVHRVQQTAPHGTPVFLKLADDPGEGPLFRFMGDGSLSGTTLDGYALMIRLDHQLIDPRQGTLNVGVSWLATRNQPAFDWAWSPTMAEMPGMEAIRFDELYSALVLTPDEWLVIGPARNVEKDSLLVGHRFLQRVEEGTQRDVLLFIRFRPREVGKP